MKNAELEFKDFDRIEAYLFGSMPSTERQEFEKEMSTDAELTELVKTHRLEHHVMAEIRANDIRNLVSSWQEQPKVRRLFGLPRRQFIQLAAAATVVVAVSVIGWRTWGSKPSSLELSEQLMAKSFGTRARSSSTNTEKSELAVIEETMKAEKPNYAQIALNLEKLPASVQTQYPDRIGLLRGLCQYRMKDFKAAVATFDTIRQNGLSYDIRKDAAWKHLLSLLAIDEKSTEYQNALKTFVQEYKNTEDAKQLLKR